MAFLVRDANWTSTISYDGTFTVPKHEAIEKLCHRMQLILAVAIPLFRQFWTVSCFDPGNPALNYSTQYCRWHCSSSWCCFRWSSTGCWYFEYLAPFQAFRWPTRSDKILSCLVAPMFVGCWTKGRNTSQGSFQGVSSRWTQSATFFSYTFGILSWRSRWRDI